MFPQWLMDMFVVAGGGVMLAAILAVARLWVRSALNTSKIESHSQKVAGIFERLDKISDDVSYLRGQRDGS